jgi:hypothetical protein
MSDDSDRGGGRVSGARSSRSSFAPDSDRGEGTDDGRDGAPAPPPPPSRPPSIHPLTLRISPKVEDEVYWHVAAAGLLPDNAAIALGVSSVVRPCRSVAAPGCQQQRVRARLAAAFAGARRLLSLLHAARHMTPRAPGLPGSTPAAPSPSRCHAHPRRRLPLNNPPPSQYGGWRSAQLVGHPWVRASLLAGLLVALVLTCLPVLSPRSPRSGRRHALAVTLWAVRSAWMLVRPGERGPPPGFRRRAPAQAQTSRWVRRPRAAPRRPRVPLHPAPGQRGSAPKVTLSRAPPPVPRRLPPPGLVLQPARVRLGRPARQRRRRRAPRACAAHRAGDALLHRGQSLECCCRCHQIGPGLGNLWMKGRSAPAARWRRP